MALSEVGDATLVCELPSEFVYRGGRFYVMDPALGFARAMSTETFLRNFESAAKALLAYHSSEGSPDAGAQIIPFRKTG